ncbi:MAG: citramalate synthase [Spirochaetaceae bacterium]|jgi:2-isopropylmalate synthase|nr:citramalate synthase [Spirochaetaceae bacterium]
MVELELLDTTLRDGAQGEGIAFSVQDKLAVVRALDELGIPWIEAGNPGSNPKDMEFFRRAEKLSLEKARLCAFGPTRKPGIRAAEDPQLRALLEAHTPGVAVFGKAWNLHVTRVLRVDPAENLAMIAETVAFLKAEGRTVIYDAEHFFDGFAADGDYALQTVRAALDGGADRIVLCDTNGGAFPAAIAAGVSAVLRLGGSGKAEGFGARGGRTVSAPSTGAPREKAGKQPPPPPSPLLTPHSSLSPLSSSLLTPHSFIGIHAHNDMGLAIANALEAVGAGCRHVQGTLAGFGERCGNTSLAGLIPSLELKLGFRCLPEGRLSRIAETTRRVAEIANITVPGTMPYGGASAFSHKGGMHSDGVLKVSRSFEHIDPSLVGNNRRLLMSEVGGRAAVAERAKKIDPSFTKDHPVTAALAEKLKLMEAGGWAFEGADARFELLVRRELDRYAGHGGRPGDPGGAGEGRRPLFAILAYRVVSEHPTGETIACSHAWVKVLVEGQEELAASEGDGPVNALDGALRRALTRFYPALERVRLSDYKVRVIDGSAATAAKVRVLIESTDGVRAWSTVGVSEDIIDASRAALVDSIEYKLLGDIEGKRP